VANKIIISKLKIAASRLLLIASAATLFATSLPVQVSAISIPQSRLYSKDIRYLDDRESQACEAGGGSTNLVGRDNPEKAFNYFKSKGLSENSAAGIVGNLIAESGVDPEIVQASGYGHGIAQWETVINGVGSGRWDVNPPKNGKPANVKDFSESPAGKGRSMTDLSLQLDFLTHELENFYTSSFEKIKAAQSSDVAAFVFMAEVEIPEDRAPNGTNAQHRKELAAKVLADYGTGVSSGGGGSTNAGGCGVASGGTIVQTAIGLAWPERFADANPRQPGRTSPLTPTPAYVSAVAEFNPTKVGVGYNQSIDCGVFVSTVMRMSGADPDYPPVGTSIHYNYLATNPDKYRRINNPTRADLQPGDILIIVGHTWIYAGPQANGETDVSASLNDRAPNFGNQELGGYTLFRRLL